MSVSKKFSSAIPHLLVSCNPPVSAKNKPRKKGEVSEFNVTSSTIPK